MTVGLLRDGSAAAFVVVVAAGRGRSAGSGAGRRRGTGSGDAMSEGARIFRVDNFSQSLDSFCLQAFLCRVGLNLEKNMFLVLNDAQIIVSCSCRTRSYYFILWFFFPTFCVLVVCSPFLVSCIYHSIIYITLVVP